MSNKTRNPNIDYGFHMVIPRLVRTEYKDVSCTQKWLYTCLKDLCGDTGTCYRTLRVLSEETGMSTGMLSESIPALHKAGLIHAEKKRRSTGGKEVWHITIVDIWQANAKAHPTKRSQNEQTKVDENVQEMNVHNVNEVTGECSCGEQECSQIRHRSNNTLSTNITEELTEDTDSATASAVHPSPSSQTDNHSQGGSNELDNGQQHSPRTRNSDHRHLSRPDSHLQERLTDDVDDSSSPHASQEDVTPQPSQNSTGLATVPLTAENANVAGTPSKNAPESEIEVLPPPSKQVLIAPEDTGNTKPDKPRKPKRTDEIAVWYTAISGWFPKYLPAEYAPDFCLPQTKRRNEAIVSLLEAKVSLEDAEFVFGDICKDKDIFWQKHRDITAVNSQFSSRISKKPKTIRTAQSNGNSPQQQESFRVLKQVEVMILPLEERKEYNRQYRAYLQQQQESPSATRSVS